MMTIYFQNSRGGRTALKSDTDIRTLRKTMMDFCRERGFRVYYTRQWVKDGEIHFDVGSHSEFFIVTGPIEEINKAVME